MAKGSVLRAVELSDPTLEPVVGTPTRLDIGCGKTTPEGWEGVDAIDFGQKHVFSVAKERAAWYRENHRYRMGELAGEPVEVRYESWPFANDSVSEARSSHFVEHLTWDERVHVFNELWRVLKPDATALIITPNWSHSCFYGDPTHKAPLSQWYPLYLHKEWRAANAPHDDVGHRFGAYVCHFDHVVAGSWDQTIEGRNPETKSMMMNNYTNAWRDLIITLTKRV